MKKIESKNKVDKETISTYEQIDTRKTIKEWLLHRGVSVCSCNGNTPCKYVVLLDDLVYMAIIDNCLKFNQTNKQYVAYWLCVGAHRLGLWHDNKYMEVTQEIYDEAKAENEAFVKGGAK